MGIDAVDAETAGPEIGQIDRRRASLPEDHVGLAGIAVAARVSTPSSDDQVGQAIAVDVAGAGDAEARAVIGIDAVDAEAAGPEIAEIDVLCSHDLAERGPKERRPAQLGLPGSGVLKDSMKWP